LMTTRPDRLLRLPQVREKVGLGRSAVYRLISEGLFPPGVRIGERAVAWRESDLDAWIATRPPTR
jgi:prophage regulatory protein